MAKRGCGHYLLVFFRVLQFILSLVALACAIYMTTKLWKTLYQYSNIRWSLHFAISKASPLGLFSSWSSSNLAGVYEAHVSQASWSTALIIYLFFAHRSAQKAPHDLKRNSRKIRLLLSLITLLLWITALVCSILLVIEYGVFAITIGAETKAAVSFARSILEQALAAILSTNDTIADILNIVSSIMTIGFMAIVLCIASSICGVVELVSCFIACCVSGKARPQDRLQYQETMLEKNSVQVVATPVA